MENLSNSLGFVNAMKSSKSLQVQSVLFNNTPESIFAAVNSMVNSINICRTFREVRIVLGDCSPTPCLSESQISDLKMVTSSHGCELDYQFFDENLGSAAGHNRLASFANVDYLLISNPDVIHSPNNLTNLISKFDAYEVGIAESKQIPIEHPKTFQVSTGKTSWASTACSLINYRIFKDVGGFDEKSFFLYCDDVDFSWRVRQAGYSVIYAPNSVVFHDKRLSNDAKWMVSESEEYYSAEAALFLSYKWSRFFLHRKLLRIFKHSGSPVLFKAYKEFNLAKSEGRLPEPIDKLHRFGYFKGGFYSEQRFDL